MNQPLPACKYGGDCYRRNPAHLAQFSHPPPQTGKRAAASDSEETPKAKRKFIGDIESPDCGSADTCTASAGEAATTVTATPLPTSLPSTAAASLPSSQEYAGDDKEEEEEKEDNRSEPGAGAAPEQDLTDCPVYVPVDKLSRQAVGAWLKSRYGVPFPDDFYQLWDFCSQLDASNPRDSLKRLLGISLVGPYDFLAGAFACASKSPSKSLHLHWRFFFDPPEFLTILTSSNSLHWGYFRDDPQDMPAFVAEGKSDVGQLRPATDTAMAAILSRTISTLAKEKDPATVKDLTKLRKDVEAFAAKCGCSLRMKSVGQARDRKVNARTFNRIGIVVPYDKKEDIGYRPLSHTDGQLRRLLDNLVSSTSKEQRDKYSDEVQEIVTCVQFANDECDYGMGLELGIDLFTNGSRQFHSILRHLLPTSYELLSRDVFAMIIRDHLADRSASHAPSILV